MSRNIQTHKSWKILLMLIMLFVLVMGDKKKQYEAQKKNRRFDGKHANPDWACNRQFYDTTRPKKADGTYVRRTVMYMKWPDHYNDQGYYDIFFDRLVYIHHEGDYEFVKIQRAAPEPVFRMDQETHPGSVALNGVIISDNQVLTSFNPWRAITKYKFTRYYTRVCALHERNIANRQTDSTWYYLFPYELDCARQVIPTADKNININMWHGTTENRRKNTPLHDLMVIRVNESFIDLEPNEHSYGRDWHEVPLNVFLPAGPIMTELASMGDVLGNDLKFAMMGHSFHKDLTIKRKVYVSSFDPEDKVETDCDGWLPREWGWFICLRNLQRIKRLASGAMLYSNEKLFGVGSYALFKGNQSVLVFTDVRPYRDLIYNTCTKEDQNLKPPKEEL